MAALKTNLYASSNKYIQYLMYLVDLVKNPNDCNKLVPRHTLPYSNIFLDKSANGSIKYIQKKILLPTRI